MSDNGDNYDNSDDDVNFSDDDSFIGEDEENVLFTEGVDNSNNIKIEDNEDDKKSEISEDEIDDFIEIKTSKRKKFVSGVNKIYPSEVTKLLSKLAKSIEDSSLTVPNDHKDFIVGDKTCSIEIARKWFDNRHIDGLELPQYIYRTFHGYSVEIKNPSKMKTDCELSFNGLIEEDIYFHQGFKKDGYEKN